MYQNPARPEHVMAAPMGHPGHVHPLVHALMRATAMPRQTIPGSQVHPLVAALAQGLYQDRLARANRQPVALTQSHEFNGI